MLKLLLNEVDDIYSRENFKRIEDFNIGQNILKCQWLFVDHEFPSAVTAQRFKHNLKTPPIDVIQTYKTGAGNVTWEYDLFDSNYFFVTTSGPCKIRAFLGRYKEGSIV